MSFGAILRQAWHNVRSYRALWIFGIVLALVTFSWESTILLSGDSQESSPARIQIERLPGETVQEALQRALEQGLDQAGRDLDALLADITDLETRRYLTTFPTSLLAALLADMTGLEVGRYLVTFLTSLLAAALVLYLAGRVARYVSETALIKMVNRAQETGEQQTRRQGLRLGWSRSAWRLFLIELVVNLVAVAGSLLLFALIFGSLPFWVQGRTTTVVVGAIVTAALFFLGLFVVIVAAAAVSLVKIFSRRACAIEGLGVTASVYRGYSLARANLRQLLAPALVMLAINLGWPVLVGVLIMVLFGIGIIAGGLPALLVRWLVSLAAGTTTAIVIAVAVGVLLLILVLVAPLVWLDGLREVFLSSMWTLTYHELCRLERQAQETPPEIPPPATGESSATAGPESSAVPS